MLFSVPSRDPLLRVRHGDLALLLPLGCEAVPALVGPNVQSGLSEEALSSIGSRVRRA
jgi:hypothetical protein